MTVATTFHDTLKHLTGVYLDESRISSKTPDNMKTTVSQTIFLTMVNADYQPQLLLNFQCFIKRLGLKVMIVGSNPSVLEDASTDLAHYYHFNRSDFSSSRVKSKSLSSEVVKSIIILEILHLGYNVLFAEPDVIMLRNPLPYLLHRNMDLVFATNTQCAGGVMREQLDKLLIEDSNESFFFVHSNIRTIKLWNDTLQLSTHNKSHGLSEVQHIKQLPNSTMLHTGSCRDVTDEEQVLRNEEQVLHNEEDRLGEIFDIDFSITDHQSTRKFPEVKGRKLTMCFLNSCMFSSCMQPHYNQLLHQLRSRNLSPITVQANCGNSTKQIKDYLQAAGLWMFRPNEEGQCDISWLPRRYHRNHNNDPKPVHKKPAKLEFSDNIYDPKPAVIGSRINVLKEKPVSQEPSNPTLVKSNQEIQSIQKALLIHQNRIEGANKLLRNNKHRNQPRREVKDTTVLTKAKKYEKRAAFQKVDAAVPFKP